MLREALILLMYFTQLRTAILTTQQIASQPLGAGIAHYLAEITEAIAHKKLRV